MSLFNGCTFYSSPFRENYVCISIIHFEGIPYSSGFTSHGSVHPGPLAKWCVLSGQEEIQFPGANGDDQVHINDGTGTKVMASSESRVSLLHCRQLKPSVSCQTCFTTTSPMWRLQIGRLTVLDLTSKRLFQRPIEIVSLWVNGTSILLTVWWH